MHLIKKKNVFWFQFCGIVDVWVSNAPLGCKLRQSFRDIFASTPLYCCKILEHHKQAKLWIHSHGSNFLVLALQFFIHVCNPSRFHNFYHIGILFNAAGHKAKAEKNTPVCPIRKSRLVANENHKSIFLWVSKRWTRPDAAASSIINAYTDFCVKQFCSLFSSMHLRLWCLELTLFLSWNLWVIISSCN